MIDGSGAARQAADVAIAGADRRRRAPLAGEAAAPSTRGHVVAPGFIDAHSHSDCSIWSARPPNPSSARAARSSRRHVLVLAGARASVPPGEMRAWVAGIGAKLTSSGRPSGSTSGGSRPRARRSISFTWSGTARCGWRPWPGEPSRHRRRDPRHGAAAGGGDGRGRLRLLHGARVSPSVYGDTEELIALARSMARRGGFYFSHIRGDSATLETAVAEAIQIGEDGGVAYRSRTSSRRPRALGRMDRASG